MRLCHSKSLKLTYLNSKTQANKKTRPHILVAAIYWMRGEISRAPGYKNMCHTTKVAAKVDILSHFVGKYDANGRN